MIAPAIMTKIKDIEDEMIVRRPTWVEPTPTAASNIRRNVTGRSHVTDDRVRIALLRIKRPRKEIIMEYIMKDPSLNYKVNYISLAYSHKPYFYKFE